MAVRSTSFVSTLLCGLAGFHWRFKGLAFEKFGDETIYSPIFVERCEPYCP